MTGWLDWQDQCPYCGETITLYIDPDNNDSRYIEDCSVCCHPINVTVTGVYNESGYCIESILLGAENE
ncbi:MAG: CPXCG motif-containing cysteine-rich protein [Gammaproteobacteria bacterium]|nr:CPXCG motif-containing cysteine-rich protein [Gammaproteobacteria bacterium]